ncbi:hypothetical protein H4J58_05375 [Colwellia sp. MB3u-70]|uniref:hypothetical protein n=1 Tax=unclassified Colwellia TaxID=196834 RepID=UPI0015F55F4C|nr:MULTISPECIES: hypothetical protein [unclassified Colwellia]MBA6292961.1 hypothetical protein [Colwellia sp. MB3u-8]MBA6306542.1 hypothetical protein [Colwellia sp. MB3u-70]
MDVFVSLLPASFTAKTERLEKDSREKQQQQSKKTPNALIKQLKIKITSPELSEYERRSGRDRRQKRIKRGRWLESRDRNDRRATALNVIV